MKIFEMGDGVSDNSFFINYNSTLDEKKNAVSLLLSIFLIMIH